MSDSSIVYRRPEPTGDDLLDQMLELQAYRAFKERNRQHLLDKEKRRREIHWLLKYGKLK